ncbi:YraN family protein [Azoarcus sp. L1K30]|uniref:YraN family protein n=1 Tax=Azoarcus sp. L1K30 TaxID=2820277 RepID=UPI001B81773C|nr:YraN family protein [Azoarcus sp. L1K30]MBR0566683.1 YraN family protein [Azoarcus sp. L1K30]
MKKPENEGKVTIVGGRTTLAQARGRMAEDIAAAHLTRHGLRILARNVRCRGGEVDLIALERGTITFVEVRLRKNQRFGGAAASITATKQARVIHAARWWLAGMGRQYADSPCRFDAIVFETIDAGQPDWIRGAFDAS